MPILHVSLDFTNLADAALDEFCGEVLTQMTGNAAFATPVPALNDVSSVRSDYETALLQLGTGGKAATAAKNAARTALENIMRELAAYVEKTSANNLAVLLSSGFNAASTNRASVPLDKPASLVIKNGVSTQLLGKVPAVRNAKTYEARIQPPTGPAAVVNVGSDSRRLEMNGLTPGLVYTISIRALGGSTGASDWSDPVSHMCM